MTGGYRTGWFRATLFAPDGVTELARSTGNDSGMGNSATYPATLTAPAPTTPGTYTWVIAWYGNKYDASAAAFGANWTPDPNNTNTGTANAQHGWEKVNLPSFTVAAATVAPSISSISPTSMSQGTTNSTLTISGTNLTGATLAFSGTGITTGTATVTATSITVPVTIAATATTGARTVTVTTAGGSASSAFTVSAAAIPAPTVSSVTPASLVQGAVNQTVTIAGTNLTGATINFSNAGVTHGTATVTTTSISMPVSVTAGATTGAGTVTVTTATGSASSAFTVSAAAIPAPTVSSVTPASLVQGAVNQTVTIAGTNLAGATITFSNAGVTHGAATVTATSISMPVSVTAGATTGAGTVTVTTATGSASSAFTVTAAAIAAPTVSSVTPASLVQGAANQTVTIAGTNLTGATITFSNAGVTHGAATVTATSISMPVSVTAGATTGAGTVTVTTATGSASSAFTVTAAAIAAPTISSVTPASLVQGAANQTVTIAGTNLTGATITFSNAGVTHGAATVTATSISMPVSVTAGAATGAGTVTVTTATGSASSAFSVTAASGTDTTKPTLTISCLADGSYTNKATLNISGNASDAGGIKSVTINGKAVVVNPAGSFSHALTLAVGANTITVIATDKAGNQQTDIRTITYDRTAPVLTVSAPADNSTSVQSFITLTGTISENSTVTVTDNNGTPQNASINGTSFSATVNLTPEVNTIHIKATDLAGNTTTAKRTVIYDSGAMTLAVTNPNQDITTSKSSLVLTGTIADALSRVTVRVTMNGRVLASPAVIKGAFSTRLTFTQYKTYAITVTARDAAGISRTVTRNVIYRKAGDDGGQTDD
jgi:hypothetical protein